MKKTVFLFLSALGLLHAQGDLSMLIEKAQENELVEIYNQKVISSDKGYDAAFSAYIPKINLGANALVNGIGTEVAPLEAGQIYTAKAELNIVLLDGFRRENLLDEKSAQKRSSRHSLADIKKQVSLNVSSLFFSMKNIKADIKALEQKKEQLQEQLKRQEKFFAARLVTEDNVERIKAAIANTNYQMEVKLYSFDEAKAKLYTLTDILVEDVDESSIVLPNFETTQELDTLKAINEQSVALGYKAQQAKSVKYPTIVLNDTFSYSEYADDSFDAIPIPGLERLNAQNRLVLSLSMNAFDYGAANDQKEAILAERNALKSNLAYQRKSANADLKLAKRAIARSLALIEAAKTSQDASKKTFDIIDTKYKARVVDYVKYLDALSQLTDAQAQYNRALGALEISYARYYFYAGFDVKDFIK